MKEKASGSITIADVGKSVTLATLGSCGLRVALVKGDLTVKSKVSGSVSYTSIDGKVDVPKQ